MQNELNELYPSLKIVACVNNGLSAVEFALKYQPDILFLDIKMPALTGLEAAVELADQWEINNNEISKTNKTNKAFPLLVFITAYSEYAIQAFELQAIDYILKPVQTNRLKKTVDRLKSILEKNQNHTNGDLKDNSNDHSNHHLNNDVQNDLHHETIQNETIQNKENPFIPNQQMMQTLRQFQDLYQLISLHQQTPFHHLNHQHTLNNTNNIHHENNINNLNYTQKNILKWLPVSGINGSTLLLDMNEIIYFEAADKYIRVLTKDKEYLIRMSLKELTTQIDKNIFWQIHRAIIVRVQAIDKIIRHSDQYKQFIVLKDRSEQLPISRVYAHLFKAK